MTASSCLGQLFSCATRVSRLASTGAPMTGPDNMYVSGSLMRFASTPTVEAGTEINVKNACDDLCFSYKAPDKVKRYGVEVEICVPDPRLSEMMTAGKVLTNGGALGYAYPRLNIAQAPNGVSIEMFVMQVDSDGNQDATYPWAWWVWPKVILRPGAREFKNAALNNIFVGDAYENPLFLDGPANDWPTDSDRVAQWIETDFIPDIACATLAVAS